MTSENPDTSPQSNVEKRSTDQRKPGIILILFTVLLILLNALISFTIAADRAEGMAYIQGYLFSRVLLFPLLAVGLFQLGKRFRNARSRTKIFFWTSVVVLLSLLGNLASLSQQG